MKHVNLRICLFTLHPFPPIHMKALILVLATIYLLIGVNAFQNESADSLTNFESTQIHGANDSSIIPQNENLLKAVDSVGGTIAFTSPANGSYFLNHAPIPFLFETSDGNWTIVAVQVTCTFYTGTGRDNSSGIVYVTAPFSTEGCNATITSSPGYTPINYVQLNINTSFCLSQSQQVNSTFDDSNPLSVTFQFTGTAPIQTVSISEFTGNVDPLYAMSAALSSRGTGVQFYQSECTSSNGTNDFNMAFAFWTNQLLSDCSNYNNQQNLPLPNYFVPYESFSPLQGLVITGDYVVNVTANSSITGTGNISTIGMELCYETNYLQLTTSLYAVPGTNLSYTLTLGMQPTFGTLANVTLTCDSDIVWDSFLVTQGNTDVHLLLVPDTAPGTCILYAYSLTDADYIAADFKILTATNDTIVYISSPTSGSEFLAGSPISITVESSKPIINANGTVNINCTVGSESASGPVPGQLNISPSNYLYGDCILSLVPSAEYITGEDVAVVINRQVLIALPRSDSSVIAGQQFAVLINAAYYTPNDVAVLTVSCVNDVQYFGKVGQVFYPTMDISFGGVCHIRANVIGNYYLTSRQRRILVISPLVFTPGLPNPSVGGQAYQVQVDVADGTSNVPVSLTLSCPFGGQATGQSLTGSTVNFTISEEMNGIGCIFYAGTDNILYANTSQTLDVSMSPSVKAQQATLLGALNFLQRLTYLNEQDCNYQKIKNKRSRRQA